MKELINKIKERFPISDVIHKRKDLTFVTIPKIQAVQFITYLRDIEKFTHLVLFNAVDYLEDDEFQLTYILHNYESSTDIGVRVKLDRRNPVMESIHHLWAQAKTHQKEMKEMFGIDFPDSPEVNESFLLEGWDNVPPMRRDFDTKKYSEETYFQRPGRVHHDPQEYMKKKLYPEKDPYSRDEEGTDEV